MNTINNDNQMIQTQSAASDRSIAVSQSSRQIAEVQAATIMAKQYPRDETHALTKILTSCKRKKLAEVSQYSYPRGGTAVTGPSIRLAETIARYWGNLDFGIAELEQRHGESVVMAYCIDLETNTRESKTFTVPHVRHTKGGQYALTDPRDIYEMVANQGARRLRSCILGIIPGEIVDMAVEECDKTLAGSNDTPLIDRVRAMVVFFDQSVQVSQAMLELRLGHRIEATSETELVGLKKIVCSLKDNMSKREDWFVVGEEDNQTGSVAQAATAALTPEAKPKDKAKPKTTKTTKAGKKKDPKPAKKKAEPEAKPKSKVEEAQAFIDDAKQQEEELPQPLTEAQVRKLFAKARSAVDANELAEALIENASAPLELIEGICGETIDSFKTEPTE